MEINQLKAFLTVARCMNITNAASQLYISQSALSRQISALERELNIQLFIRRNRKIQLTPAGKVFYKNIEPMLDQYGTAMSEAYKANKFIDGSVVIGVADGMKVDDILARVISNYLKDHPNIELRVRISDRLDLISGLFEGDLDVILAMYFSLQDHSNISVKELEKSKCYILMNSKHRYADRKMINIKELKDETFICTSPEYEPKVYEIFIEKCKKNGFVPKCIFTSNSYESYLFVCSDMGISFSDSRSLYSDTVLTKCVEIENIGNPNLCLAWYEGNDNEAGRLLRDYF